MKSNYPVISMFPVGTEESAWAIPQVQSAIAGVVAVANRLSAGAFLLREVESDTVGANANKWRMGILATAMRKALREHGGWQHPELLRGGPCAAQEISVRLEAAACLPMDRRENELAAGGVR